MSVPPRTREPEIEPSAAEWASMRPFPWGSLEATSRAEIAARTEIRRWVAQHVRLDAFGAALTALVGADVRVLVGTATRVGALAVGRGLHEAVGMVLAPADEDGQTAALLEVEPALAATVVARVLRRPPAIVANLAAPPSGAVAGAMAAVVIAAARRAHAGAAPMRVVAAGAAQALEPDFIRVGPPMLAVSLTVLVGDDAYSARLVVRRPAGFAAEPPAWTAGRLTALGELPLSLPIVACASRVQVADVAALRAGDAWLPGAWPLELARGDGASAASRAYLVGPVLLAAPTADFGVRARLVDGGRLVLSGEVDAVCAEADMTESDDGRAPIDGVIDAVGDVPVVVRVEIGEARMAARDWAALGRGDVIALGRRVGELVVVRVGGVAVARGELVNVDGEVGVRIAERIGGDTTSA
jgi:flagellar motor switch/type III secretory pathway protein FliN